MPKRKCRSQMEVTNGGCCFSECSCGWRGGVYPSKHDARYAWNAHATGQPIPPNIRTVLLIGDRARGMQS